MGQSSTRLLFYLIENRETGDVIRRGTVADAGLLQNELILAPSTIYREWLFNPATGLLGFEDFETPTAGQRFRIPPIRMRIPVAPDSDRDGLSDDAEYIVGTNPNLADTDGDGVKDGAEIAQGLNAVNGLAVRTGVVGGVDTPGTGHDVAAFNGLVVLADGAAGIAVFNAFDGSRLVRLAQVDTPGAATRVAGAGNLVAVADGAAGLAVIDITTPAQAGLIRQINVGGTARSVAVAAGIGFVGTTGGQLLSVDLVTGTILARVYAGAEVHDLALGGDALFVLAGNNLKSYRFDRGGLEPLGTAPASAFIPDGMTGTRRLFVGGGVAYVTSYPGYDTFDVSNPAAMARLGNATDGGFNAFKQIVVNGSGLGLAAVGVSPGNDGTHNISLYNVSNPAQTTTLITTLATPGVARAVCIYNGLAYVADSEAGLQVLNYRAYDTGTNPPAISLAASFPVAPPAAEEGKIARLTAQVADDVQVRNVEFYLDGQRVATDGNFPFEHRFVTPLRTSGRTNFTVQARAFDTGGNATWSALLTVALVPDATPPEVAGTFPANAAIVGALRLVSAAFNEPINPATLDSNSFRVATTGVDGLPGTADDVFAANGVLSYNNDARLATLTFPTNLAPGAYAIIVKQPVADLAGNVMVAAFTSRFWITGGLDTDQDGIPDNIEPLLGLNPANPDSDGDGLWDGDEDSDVDGLRNSWEILWGLNPLLADSDSNGVPDGAEDADTDGLTNLREQAAGTNPLVADSDGDGWNDETEITGGSNPLDPASKPKLFFASRPPAALAIPVSPTPTGSGALQFGVLMANPPSALAIPVFPPPTTTNLIGFGAAIASPPAALAIPVVPASTAGGFTNFGAVIARPPAQIQINTNTQ